MVCQELISRWPVLLTWKLRTVFLCVCCCALAGLLPAQNASARSDQSSGTFTLSGTVVNSVTGEPIGRAMVRLSGVVQRMAFTDSEGHFQIEGVQEGYSLEAQKPGYFTPQGSEDDGRNKPGKAGSDTGSALLKLTPMSAVYGRVMDASGQSIERLPLRLSQRTIRDGRPYWNPAGFAQSDEDGRFRFANLMPGAYYLEAGPGTDETRILVHNEKPKTGYPCVYYPNAPEIASASPIQLGPGQQAQADFSMPEVPAYHVSGTVTGFLPDQHVGLLVLSQSGDPVSIPARLRWDLGTFEINAIPAGSYVLRAILQGEQPLRAEIRLNVAANLDNVHLVLAPEITIPVTVRAEPRSSNSTVAGWDANGPPPVSVRLTRLDLSSSGSVLTEHRGNQNGFSIELKGLDPGKYAVDLMPNGQWYVQSAVYGETNLLVDDLTLVPGQNYPMEIVLRDDGATLTGNVKSSDGTEAPATILAVPQSSSRRRATVGRSFPPNGFTLNQLAPGEYLVFAFDHADKLEYANANVLQPYASQAARVTLTPNQETHVALNLIRAEDGE